MKKKLLAAAVAAVLGMSAASLPAQSDARKAYETAKEAFAAGQYEKSRELLLSASQLDAKNPEVHLWLGKACYQMGLLDEAMVAWGKTLELAPEEAYAKKMLSVLRGQTASPGVTLAVIDVMLKEQQFDVALAACDKLLADKALSDAQRCGAMTRRVEALVGVGRAKEVSPAVQEILVRYEKLADVPQLTVTLGRAAIRLGGEKSAEGVALLRKIINDTPGTDPAKIAQYELANFELDQGPTAERVEALAKWVAANAEHPMANTARIRLVDTYLARSALANPRTPTSALGPDDIQAIVVADTLYKRFVRADDADKLTARFVNQIGQFNAAGAYNASIAAADMLLKSSLPRSSRQTMMAMANQSRAGSAIRQLSTSLTAGATFRADALPPQLGEVIAGMDAYNKEFTGFQMWQQQAELAEKVRSLSSLVVAPAGASQMKAPQGWAVLIAMPLVKIEANPAASAAAMQTISGIINELSACPERWAKEAALDIQTQLAGSIYGENPQWIAANWRQFDLTSALAAMDFADNVRAGKPELNAALSERQKSMLKIIETIVGKNAAQASPAMDKLIAHLQPWIAAGQEKVVDEAFAQATKALPESRQPLAKLAVARIGIGKVTREHDRLLTAGLAPPKALDANLSNILQSLYTMQTGLKETDPLLAEIRGVWSGIVEHYKRLEYHEAAEAAVKVAAEAKVDLADAWAQFTLARLGEEAARRDLEQLLKQRDGAKKLALTPAYKSAIEAYQKFLTDRPTSNLAPGAIASIYNIAAVYTQREADGVAAGIYRDFAAFAAKNKALSQAMPGSASVAEQSAFLAASSLESAARRAMAKALSERKPDSPPITKISDEWAAAIDAYKALIKDRPTSVYLSAAIQQITSAAMEYAKVDAWDVADGVYGDLLASKPDVRSPERLEFCRGVCQLGKAIPDHARQVLGTLSMVAPPKSTGSPADMPLVMEPTTPAPATRAGIALGPKPVRDALKGKGWADGRAGGRGGEGGGSGSGPGYDMPGEKDLDKELAKAADDAYPDAKRAQEDLSRLDQITLATIHQQESQRAAKVAMMTDGDKLDFAPGKMRSRHVGVPALSQAELARLDKAMAAAYDIFTSIRSKHPTTITAEQSRGEIMVMVTHWRTLNQWQRSAAMVGAFLKDNPNDAAVPQLRLQIGRDYLAWAAQPIDKDMTRPAMLAEVAQRFEKARTELMGVIKTFADEKPLIQQAQWDIASSFLTQARVVDGMGPTLSRGQYVRAAKELRRVAGEFHDHPNISQIPGILWSIATELNNRGHYEEAILAYSDLINFDPTTPAATSAAQNIAGIYQLRLQRPLRAVETYLEINFARGGNDAESQNAVFAIGNQLKTAKRWVEALHVLETFVDSFPRHANAGQALTMIGQIHQANEAWEDAIAAYKRVINEYPASGAWVQDARWSIAESTINLSKWRDAIKAYEEYKSNYPSDAKVAEAARRVLILKDLDRYQTLIDEGKHAKAFDAQFQIGAIVRKDLANPAKAIIEFRKVAEKYPQSHLADDALYYVGEILFQMGEIEKGREAMLQCAEKYPDSTFADDALFAVGQSYERESVQLAGLTRGSTEIVAREKAQKKAYQEVSQARSSFRAERQANVTNLNNSGKNDLAEIEMARNAGQQGQFDQANFELAAAKAEQVVETLTTTQLADRQDKINAALRRAVDAYGNAAKVPQADKAGDALLRMSVIYDEQLRDSKAAVATWAEIVRQFGGRSVAEEATWRLAQYYEREAEWTKAISTYKGFLSDYRRSARAGAAQFAVAEAFEHLDKWNDAKDAYQNYINNFPDGPMVAKAREQIAWIEKYRL